MAIIGNPIYQSAFVVDQFSGNGSTVAFTMSVAPAGVTNVLVAVSGVLQDPSTYGVVGNTITFSAAPPSGTGNISCRYLGVPVTGVTTTAYRTVTEFTATASQTTFTPPSYNVGFINVYLNGVLLGSADYTATNGTTVVLATGASAGNLVTVESFQISSVANAIPNAAGSVSSSNIVTGAVTPAKLSTGGPSWDTSSNLGIGTTSPSEKITIDATGNEFIRFDKSTAFQGLVGITQNAAQGSSSALIGDAILRSQNGRVLIDTAGNTTAIFNASGMGLNGSVPSSGVGITFPATQSASSDANTLDDYEEGTWSPTLGDGTNNYTLQFVTGIYTKIGNLVTASGLLTWTSIGSAGSGGLRLSLPFAAINVNFARFGAALGLLAGFDTVGGTKQIVCNLDQGANFLTFFQTNDNAGATALPSNSQSPTGQVQFTITYTV
jgi:hypothetical protein